MNRFLFIALAATLSACSNAPPAPPLADSVKGGIAQGMVLACQRQRAAGTITSDWDAYCKAQGQ